MSRISPWTPDLCIANAALSQLSYHDVFFLNQDLGWAAGDHGAVWRTKDGGLHWHLLETGCDASLRSIRLVDAHYGWTVGARILPYTSQTAATILRTQDGGDTWETVAVELPGLRSVRFRDRNLGWALGDGDWLFPGGIFQTRDGGRHWQPIGTREVGPWLAGAATRGRLETALHSDGTILTNGLTQKTAAGRGNLPRPQNLAIGDDGFGLLVGDAGLVKTSQDGGKTWSSAEPTGLHTEQFDFQAVAMLDSLCWLAGSPGTRVFVSTDWGRSWHVANTGDSRPIHAIHFVDAQRGWAVGAQGLKLATADGGTTWTSQANTNRAGALALFHDEAAIPWEVLANYATSGYYVRVQLLKASRSVDHPFATASLGDRIHQASLAVGGSGRIPSPRVVTGVGSSHEKAIVRAIRTWRPDILITDDASLLKHPTSEQLGAATMSAVRLAGDSTSYIEQFPAGLVPWNPRQAVVVTGHDAGSSQRRVWTSKLVMTFGATLAELGRDARRLVSSDVQLAPRSWDYEVVDLTQRRSTGRSPRPLEAVPPGRRSIGDKGSLAGTSVRSLLQLRRHVDAMIGSDASAALQRDRLSQVLALAAGLDGDAAGSALYEMAVRLREHGQLSAANTTLRALIEHYPTHDCAAAGARMWLRHRCGSEWRRTALDTEAEVSLASSESSTADATKRSFDSLIPSDIRQNLLAKGRDVRTASGTRQDDSQTLELPEIIRRQMPRLVADPEVQLQLGQIHRGNGDMEESAKQFRKLAVVKPASSWNSYAQAELWLLEQTGRSPIPLVDCKPSARPHLDGLLDESCWQSDSSVIELSRGQELDRPSTTTRVRFARDDQFLFIGLECSSFVRDVNQSGNQTRRRDTDFSHLDRVELSIDVDRDYGSYWTLEVDSRGWGNDRFKRNAEWDPEWYIAPRQTEAGWICEIAVRIAELGDSPPAPGNPWAIRIRRRVPTTGTLAWPLSTDSGETFGWLRF